MKALIIGVSVLLTGLLFTNTAIAQERTTDRVWVSPNAAVTQTIGLTEIHVTYGRPGVRERAIFGGLVPFEQVWRTGANEATAIVFGDDVRVEGEHVPAGTYSLYTIPGEDEWTVIINEKLSWGTQYDEAEDLLRVSVQPEESFFMEQMMIYFENVTAEQGDLYIHWDNIRVPVRIEPVAELPEQ
ncbi:MAG: DUF2911 domain-containing protein [Balneolaceae bacterium]|nr:MAG: DUF2911 domain-containing protein [Balneolaceae bacterium]